MEEMSGRIVFLCLNRYADRYLYVSLPVGKRKMRNLYRYIYIIGIGQRLLPKPGGKSMGRLFYIGILLLLTSCASLSKFPGIGRVREYEFCNEQVPSAFDGFRIVFASDFHYKSKFKEKHLRNAVRAMNSVSPDLLLLGGDYQEGCETVPELFAELSQVQAPYGKIGVLGNNDYERCRDEIIQAMRRNGMTLLEHRNDTIRKEGQQIIISGVRNPFDLARNGVSPTLSLSPDDFVILLTHTPDYAEDTDISNSDLVLAGHTHGGQVTFLRLIVPETGSKYGRRFLSGQTRNSQGIPVIVTNGLGTSRKKIRFCAPSEIVLVVLRHGQTR